MSQSTAIGMVSESLRALLIDANLGMQISPDVPVTLLGPDEAGDDRRVNLFLYQIRENPALRNQDWQPNPNDPSRILPPPLSLNLSYLMSAYAPNDVETGNAAEHALLGEAMRVLYENPVIPNLNGILSPGLIGAREQIKITLATVNLEEVSGVWMTFNQPMRLSVLYEISVVQLDQLPNSERDMAPRVQTVGVPQITQPFAPPRVDRIEPTSGPAGSVITVHGSNLDGWNASATVLRQPILESTEISGNSFPVTLPAVLTQGFHTIQITVARLTRETFFFEVTP